MTRRKAAVLVLAFIAFISLGLPDGLLGVAWPGIRGHFNLPIDALGLFLVFATTGYMSSSFFSGFLVRRLGVGGLLAASCAATGTALLVYSVAPAWWVFVSFGLVGGLGAGAIDAGLNTYIDKHYNERLMQWLHASFGVGITIGPILMTTGISLTGRWQPGYQVAGAFQLTLAAAFFLTRALWTNGSRISTPEAGRGTMRDSAPGAPRQPAHEAAHERTAGTSPTAPEATTRESLLHWPSLLGMLLFFVYTGVELGLGLWAYTLLTEARGVDPTVAGFITGSYWASFTLGRIVAGLWSTRVDSRRLVAGGIALAVVGVVLVWVDIGPAATVAGIAVTGLVIAPIFPGLMSDTRNRVGMRHLSNTIGMQIAAAGLGGAALPGLAGVVARQFGVNAIPPFLFVNLVLLLAMFAVSRRRQAAAG